MAPNISWAAATRKPFCYANSQLWDTCFSNSHTKSNLQTGSLKAFWKVYQCSGRITGLAHWSSLCYYLLGDVPTEPSAIFKGQNLHLFTDAHQSLADTSDDLYSAQIVTQNLQGTQIDTWTHSLFACGDQWWRGTASVFCFFLLLLFKSPDLPSTAWNHLWCKGQFKGRAFWGAYAVLPPRSELPAPSICSSTGLSIMMSFNRVREENCVALFTKEPKVLVFLNLPLVWATTLLPRAVREYVRGPIQKNPINGSCTELLALTLLSKF